MTHVLQEGMCPTPPVFLCLALYAWVLLPGGGECGGGGVWKEMHGACVPPP
uniref:Uncharacterized protein n=1 Tax=Human herpesvirus 1 TaxID=10298 RepID=A0A2Z4H1X5_HHV1|nr:hypothetical protein [Human alphaherpesvirus 1]AWW08747.1 hypothetical protein [Human alphaherpesvirus 1]